MVRDGRVRKEDQEGNAAADEAADLGRGGHLEHITCLGAGFENVTHTRKVEGTSEASPAAGCRCGSKAGQTTRTASGHGAD